MKSVAGSLLDDLSQGSVSDCVGNVIGDEDNKLYLENVLTKVDPIDWTQNNLVPRWAHEDTPILRDMIDKVVHGRSSFIGVGKVGICKERTPTHEFDTLELRELVPARIEDGLGDMAVKEESLDLVVA